jgi:hypothetical protein
MAAEPIRQESLARKQINMIAAIQCIYDIQLEKNGYDANILRLEYCEKIGSSRISLFKDQKFIEGRWMGKNEPIYQQDKTQEIQSDFEKLLKDYPEIPDKRIIAKYTYTNIPNTCHTCQTCSICAMFDDNTAHEIYVVIYPNIGETEIMVKYISLFHGFIPDEQTDYYLDSEWYNEIDHTLDKVLDTIPGLVEVIIEEFGAELLMQNLKNLI